jgi:hypothetical protein
VDLPKQLKTDNLESDVRAALEKESIPLCEGSQMLIPLLKMSPELRKQIFYAKSIGELTIGYEAIEKDLANERRGLEKADGHSDRVSRLLMVSNDGSPRFYRELEFLHRSQGGRVLICRLDENSLSLGNVLGLKHSQVKAVLLNRKTSVVNVLKSLLGVFLLLMAVKRSYCKTDLKAPRERIVAVSVPDPEVVRTYFSANPELVWASHRPRTRVRLAALRRLELFQNISKAS